MDKSGFKVGDKVELISLTDWDYTNVSIGDKGTVCSIHNKEDLGCFVNMENNNTVYMYYNQIKLVEEKYVKCIDNANTGYWCELDLNEIYQVSDEDEYTYKLQKDNKHWGKSRFEEISNPQNPVKSTFSEPIKSNKMELLRPILDVIERLQELEIDKDNIEEIISRIESDEKIESSSRWYELKIQELEYDKSILKKENAELKAKIYSINFDMCDILTIVDKYEEVKSNV